MQAFRMIVPVLAALALDGALADVADAQREDDALGRSIRESVSGNWDDISEMCGDVLDLMKEMPELPESSWFGRDRNGQRERIRKIQERIRALLLSKAGLELVRRCDAGTARVAAQEEKVQQLAEKRQFSGDSSYDAKLAEAREKLSEMKAERDRDVEKVRKELSGIGLRLDGRSGDVLFRMVNRADVIDNAILARGISEIVENLRQTTGAGDVVSARRYFGVYLALADVQIACFEQYLDKSRNGPWRASLDRIEAAAAETMERAKKSMADRSYTTAQRDLFRRNIAANAAMLEGVAAYRRLLDCHERVVDRKLAELRRMRELAENSYATVSNAADFASLLSAAQREYSAILGLELPEMEGVDDAAMQEQLQAITRMLDMESGR